MKVTYTEEAVADIVQTITYLNEHNPTAAAKLDADIARCIERLADRNFEGPVVARGGTLDCGNLRKLTRPTLLLTGERSPAAPGTIT